jgi:hypothetical protein
MLYIWYAPEQMLSLPVMVPGLARAVMTVTASTLVELCPQPFSALTVMVPEELLVVTLIELLLLLPTQPEGSVHTYEVAPPTASTE